MALRLSGGVLPGPDRRIWILGPAGLPVEAARADPPPGTPVVVGPRSADADAAGQALRELSRLVGAGGTVVADVGADLGDGFRSARTQGGAGDRRDAVLAALSFPWLADRFGDPPALLVALFGPTATRPVGAAARAAIDEGRWATLRFAAAASDVLGPEQLVRLLELRAPDGVDPFPDGLPSMVGGHLARVLREVSRPRRLELLTDLWEQVCAHGSARLRRERLRAAQGRPDLVDDLRARYERFEQDEVLARLRAQVAGEPTLPQAALWRPGSTYWVRVGNRLLRDAQAATVLARVAVAALDDGLGAALARHWPGIEAAAAALTQKEAAQSARAVPGLTGLPARPGSYLRDIRGRAHPGKPLDAGRSAYVRQRLAAAGAYGTVVMRAVDAFVWHITEEDSVSVREDLTDWAATTLGPWRGPVGYLSPDRLGAWAQHPLLADGRAPTLADRLRAEPDRAPAEVETIGDLFWYAELADALAQLNGYPAAVVTPRAGDVPRTELDPRPPDEPLVPRPDSIALAAAGTAQLADLGGHLPRRCRTWPELVAGLLADAAVAQALVGTFAVPPVLAEADGTVLPGTDARIEVARTGRQLAAWSDYMGNCIAGQHYLDAAAAGSTVLLALRAPDDRILANVELGPITRGWRLAEIRARFNEDPDPDLLRRTRTWAAGLATAEPPAPVAPADLASDPRPRGARSAPGARLVRDVGDALGDRTAAALAEPATVQAVAVLAALTVRLPGARPAPVTNPQDALTALRRAAPASLVRACQLALTDADGPGLVRLWQATADRPLARAVAALPPSTAERLAPLLVDALPPRSLRVLARLPQVAPARTAALVALRVRGAFGVLLRQDAPELARAVIARPHGPLIRAAALTVTSWGGLTPSGGGPTGLTPSGGGPTGPAVGAVTAVCPRRRVRVPGFPESSLRDDLWQGAWPDAGELGAVPEGFWQRIAAHGLLVPSSWLPGGGWPALWSRAADRQR
ncbi:MAG TPA: hypothetical protein VF755_09515 [Catenuloplanes sp.]